MDIDEPKMEYKYYLLRRVLTQVIVIFGAITLTFFMIKVMPGDPVAAMLGPERMGDPIARKAIEEQWSLDKPIAVQYYKYLSNVLHGDLGKSFLTRSPVMEALAKRFPATMELAIMAFIFALIISIPLGILSATRRHSVIDYITRVFATMGVSAPSFWWAALMLLVFYLWLGLVGSGRLDTTIFAPRTITGLYTLDSLIAGDFHKFLNALKHIIIPSFVLGLQGNAVMMRLTRASMLEVLNADYVSLARIKGLSERIVIYKHVLRNAILPTTTYAGMLFGGMLGGSVLIETMFNWNGMGSFAVNALFMSDYPGLLGVTLIMIIVYSTSNLLVDILYGVIDPRVRI